MRPRAATLARGLVLLVLLAGTLTALAPALVNLVLLPRLLPPEVEARLVGLGPGGLDMAVRFDNGRGLVVTAPAVRLRWTLAGLGARRLERLELSGLRIRLPGNGAGGAGGDSGLAHLPAIPLAVRHLRVSGAVLTLPGSSGDILLPLAASGTLEPRSGQVVLRMPGTRTLVRLAATWPRGWPELRAAAALDLPALARLAGQGMGMPPRGLVLHGVASLEARARFGPAGLRQAWAELRPEAGFLHLAPPLDLHSLGQEAPLLKVELDRDQAWRLVGRLVLGGPAVWSLNLDGALDTAAASRGGPLFQGTLGLAGEAPAPGGSALPWGLDPGDLSLELGVQVALTEGVELRADLVRPVDLRAAPDQGALGAELRDLALRFFHGPGGREASVSLGLAGVRARGRGARLRIPRLRLDAAASAALEGKWQGRVQAVAEQGSLSTGQFWATGLGIHAGLDFPAPREPRDQGVIQVAALGLGKAGQERGQGSLQLHLQQDRQGLRLEGGLRGLPLAGRTLTLRGRAGLDEQGRPQALLRGALSPAEVRVSQARHLAPALLEGITGQARLEAEFCYSLPGAACRRAALRLRKGEFQAGKVRLDGVELGLELPGLPSLRSAPAQELRIARVQAGQADLRELQVRFQVEGADSLLVERAGFSWCQGRVAASSFRLRPGSADVDVRLCADRLDLADLLRQTGAAEAEGSGALSGRVPLRIQDGKVRVEQGFLYSTPGQGGSIRINGGEALSAALPREDPDGPTLSPLGFAAQALRDFRYDWARLTLESQGEDSLVMRLKVKGRPARPLPFRYDPRQGVFVRGRTALDQPLRLDVNFNIPVNALLRLRHDLRPLFQGAHQGSDT